MKGKTALSLLVTLVFLAATAVTPVWAEGYTVLVAEEGAVAFNTAQGVGSQVNGGEDNYATGIGAFIGGGSFNQAAGVGALVSEASGVQVAGIGAVAIGNYNTAIGTGVVVNGGASEEPSSTVAGVATLPNVGTGYGAVAFGEGNTAVGAYSAAVGQGNAAYGLGATAYGLGNAAFGMGATAGYCEPTVGATAIGAFSRAEGNFDTAIGAEAWAFGGNSVALGAGSVADQPNTVSVGSYGNERRITNVAPGIYSTDAVNMSQLWDTHDKMNRLGATAMAMTGLAPMAYNPKEPTQYAAAIGTYSGKQAIALGLFHYTKESVMLNAAFGWSADGWEKAGRVGVTWTGGRSTKKEPTDNTVHVSNAPGKDAAPQGGIQERVNRLLQGNSAQADKPVSAAPESAAKPVSAEVKAPEKKPDAAPEGGIQDRVNKLLNSHGAQG